MIKTWSVIIIFLVCFTHYSQQVAITLPVSQELIVRLTLSIQKLEKLLKFFKTIYENKFQIYKRVHLTKRYLLQLSNALAQYNNVIAGSVNSVAGSKNIVIGNYNNVNGNNNWIFVSQFTGEINGDLLVGQWRIEIDKANLILINTRLAISFLNQQKNLSLKRKYQGKNRQLCKWDKWTRPQNKKSTKHWQRYQGYNDWKTKIQQKTTTKRNSGGLTKLIGNLRSWGGLLKK